MMNPLVYQREAERIEKEAASRNRLEKKLPSVVMMRRGYSRETLPCGCILYRMIMQPERAPRK